MPIDHNARNHVRAAMSVALLEDCIHAIEKSADAGLAIIALTTTLADYAACKREQAAAVYQKLCRSSDVEVREIGEAIHDVMETDLFERRDALYHQRGQRRGLHGGRSR